MSLILEALRKSEAERRRAQVPDLLAEPQSAAKPVAATPQRWPWLVLGAAMLLGALWLARAWWDEPAVQVDAPILDAPIVDASDRNAAQRHATATRTPSPTSTSTSKPPARPLVLAPAAAAAPLAPASVPDASSTTYATASVPAAREPTTPPPVETAAARAAPVVAAPAPVAAMPPPTDTLLRLSDLGSEERSQLPPLKLSMHMWNDVPAQRFVIIDGNRVGIGGRIGAVAVADIVSDGVVLDWNGRLLKLPLR